VEQNIALAVADLNGDGKPDFVFADQSLDRVAVQFSRTGTNFSQDRSDGLLAPGSVSAADLNGDGIPDLVVANSGGNDLLVYLGLGGGLFAPAQTYFVGTNPAGVTFADLNGDGIPDLVVADEGSNDLFVLLGRGRGANWGLVNGPRLLAGDGPVSTTVQDVNSDGIPDLVVANSLSNNVYLMMGLGGGFFNDQNPEVFATGLDPVQTFVGHFDHTSELDLVVIDSGSNSLTLFPGFRSGRMISVDGERPVAGVVGDFSHDGFPDLLVANYGDGRVVLLQGGPNGLAPTDVFSNPGLTHPTALALTMVGTTMDIFVADEGRESAVLLAAIGTPALSALPPIDLGAAPTFSNIPGLPQGAEISAAPRDTLAVGPGAVSALGGESFRGGQGDGPLAESTSSEAASEEPRILRFLIGLPEATPAEGRKGEESADAAPATPAPGSSPSLDEVGPDSKQPATILEGTIPRAPAANPSKAAQRRQSHPAPASHASPARHAVHRSRPPAEESRPAREEAGDLHAALVDALFALSAWTIPGSLRPGREEKDQEFHSYRAAEFG
jgi:hypothetical protein